MLGAWHEALAEFPVTDLHRATGDVMRTHRKWPTPADVAQVCLGYAKVRTTAQRVRDEHNEGPREFCPRCHAKDLISRPNGRFMPFHAENCPGLHQADRDDLRWAIGTGQPVWRGGKAPGTVTTESARDFLRRMREPSDRGPATPIGALIAHPDPAPMQPERDHA